MKLRTLVISVLVVGIGFALALAFARNAALWLILACYWGAGLIIMLLERGRYRPALTGSRFEKTGERYADPVSGQTITVYADPATGQRDYRPEPGDRSADDG